MELLLLFALYAIALSVALGRAGHHSQGTTSPPPDGEPVSRILIVGATGGTGRQLVSQALQRGYSVTALARNPEKLDVEHPALNVIKGDVLDPDSLASAMRNQQAVLCALGHKRFFYPTRILSQGTRNIIRAMQDHNVSRLICETSLGIGDSAGRMGLYYTFFVVPLILPFYYWDKTRQEQLVAKSAVNWIIVRPAAFTKGNKRGQYQHGFQSGSRLLTPRISRAEAAEFMLDQLGSNAYLYTAPGVCR